MKTAAPIILSPEERSTLDIWVRRRSLPLRLVQRARIIRMAADGMRSQDITHGLWVSRPTVQLWRQRFLAFQLVGLKKDAPRPGRIAKITVKKIQAVVEATLHITPPHATDWSTRSMAKAQGLSEATIRRIWKQHNLHLIEDNNGTHKHPRVKSWLKQHPRFHLHFIPTSSSWLNLVGRWFRELTVKRIRRGTFRNVPTLITAIRDYIDNHNQNLQVFVWTAPVEQILTKVAKSKEVLDTPILISVKQTSKNNRSNKFF